MTDDRLVKVLEEIRDLHQQQVENYRQVLAQQQESLKFSREWQKRAARGQFWTFWMLVAFTVAIWLAAMVNR